MERLKWTDDEDEILRLNKGKSVTDLVPILNSRSYEAIKKRKTFLFRRSSLKILPKKEVSMVKKINLDVSRLEVDKKGRAYIIPLGDIHRGYPTTNEVKLKGYIDYCLSNHVYVLGIGDYLEAGLTSSVGDSVYRQTLNPQEQFDSMVETLRPLSEEGLLLGLHTGN